MWSRASKSKDLIWQCLHFIWFQKWATALQSWEMMVTLEASCSVGLFHQFHHGLGLWLSTFEVLSVSWWERERNSSCMLAGTQPRFTNTGTCILTPGVPHFSPSLQDRFLARKNYNLVGNQWHNLSNPDSQLTSNIWSSKHSWESLEYLLQNGQSGPNVFCMSSCSKLTHQISWLVWTCCHLVFCIEATCQYEGHNRNIMHHCAKEGLRLTPLWSEIGK